MLKNSKILFFLILLLTFLTSLWSDKIIFIDDLIEVEANPQDRFLAEEIMEHLPKLIDRFQMEIGVYPKFKQKIYLSHDKEDFQNLVATFGGITEHSNAFYSRRDNIIYIKSFMEIGNSSTFYQILHHEYIHAFIDYHFKDAPLWFHEGMAIHFSRQFSTNMVYALGLDYITNKLPTIATMEVKYPQDSSKLTSFYAKSAMAVDFLHEKNSSAFSLMFTTHPNFNIAFNKSFGFSKERFYYDFEEDFKGQIILNTIYTGGTMLGLVFPLIFFWGWIRRLFKRRKEKPQRDAEESDDDDVIITL